MRDMIIPDFYKPVRNFGLFFVIIGLCGFWVLFKNLQDIEQAIAVWLFLGPLSLFHFVLGISIILKNRLGFSIFKISYAYLFGG